jgi:hypothetical protein
MMHESSEEAGIQQESESRFHSYNPRVLCLFYRYLYMQIAVYSPTTLKINASSLPLSTNARVWKLSRKIALFVIFCVCYVVKKKESLQMDIANIYAI